MQRLKLFAGSVALFLSPLAIVSAQIADSGNAGPFQELLKNILTFTNTVLIPFIIGIGFLVFVWGMFQYFIAGGANDDAKEKGKSLMIYATLGFLLIIVFWGVINLLTASTGLEGESLQNAPTVTNPIP
jgi:uncharacterized membrane protein YidH (DUF202 family)